MRALEGADPSWKRERNAPADELRPAISGHKVILTTPYYEIVRLTASFPRKKKTYYVHDYGTRAAMIADRAGEILLVCQYRLLIDGVSWEIPGGGVEAGEPEVDAAIRECLEETGVRCRNPRPLSAYHVGLDVSYNPTFLFYSTSFADEVEHEEVQKDEVVASEWVPMERCLDMLASGEIVDSLTITGLLVYQMALATGKVGRRGP